MIKTLVSALACSAVLAAGVAQAQSTATSSDPAASSGKHAMKKHRGGNKAMGNEAGVPTTNSTGATSGSYTGSGSPTPTTPDPMQIKNARDGSPMKTSKGAMGAASGTGK